MAFVAWQVAGSFTVDLGMEAGFQHGEGQRVRQVQTQAERIVAGAQIGAGGGDLHLHAGADGEFFEQDSHHVILR